MMHDIRSGKLEVPLVVLEDEIQLHLNSAQASLDTQQIKYARKGLLSAAIVSSHAKLALTYAHFIDGKERERFQQYMELATRLIGAYWEDFGLTLLKSAKTEETVEARVAPKAVPSKPILKGSGRRPATRAEKVAILDALRSGPPDGVSKTEWYATIAEQYGYSMSSIANIRARMIARENGRG